MVTEIDYYRLREMISRCQWTYTKSMPLAPHEYIVKDKCPLTEEEFEYFVTIQRQYGVKERWGKYNNSYLYFDDYKYWTMGAPLAETIVINRAKVKILGDVFKLHDKIGKIKQEVEEKLPKQVNSIQDLWPDEPKISNILAGFFRQRINGNYQVFGSFINYCFNGSFPYEIEKPIIQTEVEVKDSKRTDILAYEKGKYAIVFENKIWNAVEQPNQLTNYIKGMREPKYGFTNEQIYIIYLPSTNDHCATNISWNKKYQESFASRYKAISFKEGILEWLDSEELQEIDDECFTHSLFLFKDYLKKMFNLTEIDDMENQKIDEYIRKELELKENDNSYNIVKLTAKYYEIIECANQLERMRKDYCCKMLKEWSARLTLDFPNCKKHELCVGKRMCTGIVLPYKDIEEAIFINLEFIDKKLCYGATYMPTTHNIREEMQASDLIRPYWESKEFVKGVDWLFYRYINVEEGYNLLQKLIRRIIQI